MPKQIPDRWLVYTPVGDPIRGTRFIAFKVPLKDKCNEEVPCNKRLTPTLLMEAVPKLGLIIDLTNTTRYYSPMVFQNKGIVYKKICVPGHMVPPNALLEKFSTIVSDFLHENHDNDKLIGVHCTHGVNRTGFFICGYMVSKMNIDPKEAIQKFNLARGHDIERQNYVKAVLKIGNYDVYESGTDRDSIKSGRSGKRRNGKQKHGPRGAAADGDLERNSWRRSLSRGSKMGDGTASRRSSSRTMNRKRTPSPSAMEFRCRSGGGDAVRGGSRSTSRTGFRSISGDRMANPRTEASALRVLAESLSMRTSKSRESMLSRSKSQERARNYGGSTISNQRLRKDSLSPRHAHGSSRFRDEVPKNRNQFRYAERLPVDRRQRGRSPRRSGSRSGSRPRSRGASRNASRNNSRNVSRNVSRSPSFVHPKDQFDRPGSGYLHNKNWRQPSSQQRDSYSPSKRYPYHDSHYKPQQSFQQSYRHSHYSFDNDVQVFAIRPKSKERSPGRQHHYGSNHSGYNNHRNSWNHTSPNKRNYSSHRGGGSHRPHYDRFDRQDRSHQKIDHPERSWRYNRPNDNGRGGDTFEHRSQNFPDARFKWDRRKVEQRLTDEGRRGRAKSPSAYSRRSYKHQSPSSHSHNNYDSIKSASFINQRYSNFRKA